jgi:hypothetical protein
LTTWVLIEQAMANQIHSIQGEAAKNRICIPLNLDRAQYHACFGYITNAALRLAQEHYVLSNKLLKACSGVYCATTGLPCAHRIEDVRGQGVSLLPSDFHKHWYWDRYSEPSVLILDPLRSISNTAASQTHRTRRLPSAFEPSEPRLRLCSQCRLPGHTRNQFRCPVNIRQAQQEFASDIIAIPTTLAITPAHSNTSDLHTNSG